MSLVFVSLMDAVGQRISIQAYQKPEYDLRVLVPALFRKPCLAKVILPIGLEVQCGNVIEHHANAAAQQLPGMAYTDILNLLLLRMVQLVQIAVYLRQIHILVEVVLQVLHRRRLA